MRLPLFDSIIVSEAPDARSSEGSPAIPRRSEVEPVHGDGFAGRPRTVAGGRERLDQQAIERLVRRRSSGSAVRLIFAFHCVSSRKYASSGSSIAIVSGAFARARAPRQPIAKLQRRHGSRAEQPADERAEHGDRGRRDARDPQRLPERVRRT
jgi:hypothetical protein